MRPEPIQIKRYPNRRFYSRDESKYVSLPDIEQLVRDGKHVEIRDSQSGEDLTRAVLTQIITERQPEKMSLFPVDMLHFIVRSNDLMTGFLRDYFRNSLTYLEYLQNHSTPAAAMAQPMHWMKAWFDGLGRSTTSTREASPAETNGDEVEAPPPDESAGADSGMTEQQDGLEQRIRLLEERLRQLENNSDSSTGLS